MPRWAAGFSLHRGLPDRAGSYVRSTSVSRLPATLGDVLRELSEIAGGVQVTVENQPADRTVEGALGQGELGFTQPQAEHVLDEG